MNINLRTEKGSKVRDSKTVPGVLYGKGFASISVTADAVDFNKQYYLMGSSKTFEVTLDGKKHLVYIKDVQPLPQNLHHARHFDLVKVSKDDTMTSKIRVTFVNKDVVERKGLIVHAVNDTIEIEYPVGKGVSQLELNVENLEENDTLLVSDVVIPEGVKVLSTLEYVVVSVSRPKEIIEEEPTDDEVEEEIVEVEAIKQKDEY